MSDEAGSDDDQTINARFDRLNRDFYSADPSDYFDVRLLSLMLLAGRPDDVLGMFANGVGYGHVYAEIGGGRGPRGRCTKLRGD